MKKSVLRALALARTWAIISVVVAGCASVDVDDRQFACAEDSDCGGNFRCQAGICAAGAGGAPIITDEAADLTFTITGAAAHVGEVLEVRVVSEKGVLRARALVETLPSPASTFKMPRAVPKTGGPHTVHFFFDHDSSGGYSGIPADHAWIRDIEGPTFDFLHVADFDPLPEISAIGGDFEMRISGASGKFAGKRLDLWVTEEASGRTVGFYRREPIPAETEVAEDITVLKIPEIIDSGSPYEVSFFVDIDDDGIYTQGVDPAWRIAGNATPQGSLTINVGLDAPTTRLSL